MRAALKRVFFPFLLFSFLYLGRSAGAPKYLPEGCVPSRFCFSSIFEPIYEKRESIRSKKISLDNNINIFVELWQQRPNIYIFG